MPSNRTTRESGKGKPRPLSPIDALFLRKLSKLREQGRPLRLSVEAYSAADALANPIIGPHAVELVLACAESAVLHGERECFGCCGRWSLERAIAGVGHVVIIDINQAAGLIGLCGDCWSVPDRAALVAEGIKRDFKLSDLVVQLMPRGGRA